MSQVDQKRAFNKLKHELEPFRVVILHTRSLLTWEKNYYAGIVFGLISLIFLILWTLDLSFLTLFALSLWGIVLFDYFCPAIARMLSNPDKWTGNQEAKFEDVCNTLCDIKNIVAAWYDLLFKQSKSTMFVIMFSIAMLCLAWIGSTINNWMLLYFISLGVAMWPGLHDKHICKTFTDQISKVLQSKTIKKNKSE